ncbi:four helix bundle protein [Patescibacteria group bacterium]|nr:four helix bundle protein [Patescibacteria group bacterium]
MYLKSYKELIVWQKSIQLVKGIFVLTDKLPKSEIYGLVSQMRRAAVSIPSNIAEGYGRRSTKEYAQFYSIAYGSTLELETQMIVCKELGLVEKQNIMKSELLLEEVAKMLNSMLGKMKSKLVASG